MEGGACPAGSFDCLGGAAPGPPACVAFHQQYGFEAGKSSSAQRDTALATAVALLVLHPALTGWLAAILLLSGLACLTGSKVSLYRQGIWLSFGPGCMSSGYACLYKVAYVLMGVGVLLVFLLLSALRLLE